MKKELLGVLRYHLEEFQKGCSAFTRQTDSGTGKTHDLCDDNNKECLYHNGEYVIREKMIPQSQFDFPLTEGEVFGSCRLHRDTVRLGSLVLYDKSLFRRPRRK